MGLGEFLLYARQNVPDVFAHPAATICLKSHAVSTYRESAVFLFLLADYSGRRCCERGHLLCLSYLPLSQACHQDSHVPSSSLNRAFHTTLTSPSTSRPSSSHHASRIPILPALALLRVHYSSM